MSVVTIFVFYGLHSATRERSSMFIISGQTVCGRVDHIPGRCYVATRFFHLYYIPLMPLSSWVIMQGTKKSPGFQGHRIRLNGKSVLIGWLQAFLVVFGFMNCIRGGFLLAGHQLAANNVADSTFKLALGLMSLGAWLLFAVRPFRAGPDRANELLKLLGIECETNAEHGEQQVF